MAGFETPTDLANNRGLISDPEAFAREKGAASWLYLCGEEFASMEGGMSYADVERSVPVTANIVSDPPTPLDLDLARRQIEALDGLPRPTLVTCRTGPRSSALIYLYAGLRTGASGRGRARPRRGGRGSVRAVRRATGLGQRRAREALLTARAF
jgi:hypothetical protein